ncbi:cell wall elongation regulator TseB-like domain-containing protein [Streptococcus suis]|uniref:cell wall elongation regulator TseB-like domain-containing protein n=1 Tax=Streptococcus suis TaxID=1307 RepID=UPI001147224B|nr:DUF5590 domain-containing protein [Streptococcus suis]NQI77217.1 DUF5590 domain-containing protein [Streptococcus suis]NQI78975.1 DUF5590 domain-containing protein [Streptococcus suis]NQI82440.1 DUF5590 domain-containing protein [Streptococcus suis]NQM14751.1 DUF5590 domain-containing protein [Streptococcus suis]TQE82656.1 peptidase [Streptococcus suis]
MEKKIFQLLEWIASKTGQLVLGSFILLSVVTFSIFTIWDIAAKPFSDVQNHAISVARDYTDIEVVDDVSIYNGTETYFSLQGKTSQGEMIAVIIPEETNTVYVYPMANGISKEEAQAVATENGAGEIEKSVLGYRDAKPIWEVKSGTAYYLVEFETGNFIKREGL